MFFGNKTPHKLTEIDPTELSTNLAVTALISLVLILTFIGIICVHNHDQERSDSQTSS